jgi:hypothetical protein
MLICNVDLGGCQAQDRFLRELYLGIPARLTRLERLSKIKLNQRRRLMAQRRRLCAANKGAKRDEIIRLIFFVNGVLLDKSF